MPIASAALTPVLPRSSAQPDQAAGFTASLQSAKTRSLAPASVKAQATTPSQPQPATPLPSATGQMTASGTGSAGFSQQMNSFGMGGQNPMQMLFAPLGHCFAAFHSIAHAGLKLFGLDQKLRKFDDAVIHPMIWNPMQQLTGVSINHDFIDALFSGQTSIGAAFGNGGLFGGGGLFGAMGSAQQPVQSSGPMAGLFGR